MWPRFNFEDVRVVAHHLGKIVLISAIAMLIPCAVALFMGDWVISSNYLIGIGFATLIGSLLCLFKIRPTSLSKKQAIAVVGMTWVLISILAAVPLYLSGHYNSILDSIFESVSGLTTTGLTLVRDLDHMSVADNLWRFIQQYIGGQGIIVIGVSLGIFAKSGTSTLYDAEAKHHHVLPELKRTARFIVGLSLGVLFIGTLILTIMCLLSGMPLSSSISHAFMLTIGCFDTGGFLANSLGINYFHSWAIELFAMFLMILGTINFALSDQLRRGKFIEFIKDIEIRTMAIWIVLVAIGFITMLCFQTYFTDFMTLIRKGIFTVISTCTNTGYQIFTQNQMANVFSTGAIFTLSIAMLMGGSSESTTGGIKALRIAIIVKATIKRIKEVLSPDSAKTVATFYHIGRQEVTKGMESSAFVITAVFLVSIVVGAAIGMLHGYEALDAIFESVSATTNTGMTAGLTDVNTPLMMKITYIVQMWLGRLEFITMLALLFALFTSIKPRKKLRSVR